MLFLWPGKKLKSCIKYSGFRFRRLRSAFYYHSQAKRSSVTTVLVVSAYCILGKCVALPKPLKYKLVLRPSSSDL